MEAKPAPESRLALRLGLGALLLVVAAWVFGAIAEDVVTGDRLTVLDTELAQALHRSATPAMTRAMLAVSKLQSTIAVGSYSALIAIALALARQWRRMTLVVVAVGGGLAVNALMKLAFHRARPVFDQPLATLSTYSFPSGHVAGSTIFYGLLVAWVFTRTRSPALRALAVAGAGVLIALVAFSRMYPRPALPERRLRCVRRGHRLAGDLHRRACRVLARTTGTALKRSIVVLLNAGSGTGNDAALAARIAGLFEHAGASADVRLARGGDLDALLREAIARRPDVVVAGGGDGTVSTVAAALAGGEIALGVLPLGTLNHFAKDMQLPLELEPAVELIARGATRRVDVGEVNGRIFINNSSLGLYPDIVRDRERQQRRLGRGKWPALVWATLGALRRFPFLSVRLNGRRRRGPAPDAVRLHRQQRLHDAGLRDRRARPARLGMPQPLRRAAGRAAAPAAACACARSSAGSNRRATSMRSSPERSTSRAGGGACASRPTARSPC